MSDGFMIWSFWILMILSLAYALYSVVRPEAPAAESSKEA